MKYLIALILLPIYVNCNLFKSIIREGCDLDGESRTYQCTKIRREFPKLYYGEYLLNCVLCDLRIFNAETFPYSNALLVFNVTDSNMENITANAFTHLVNLQHVHLERNRIRNISADAFYGMRHVYELHLEMNHLEELTPGFLNGFEANAIILSHNKMKTVTPYAFKGLHGVMSLDLSHNFIKELDKESFSNLNGMEILNLEFNQLCSVPYGLFKHLKSLRELNLSRNKFKMFPIGLFSPLTSVMHLNISHNFLMDFDTSVLLPMRRLSVLDLSANGIEFLDTVALNRNVPTLRHLGINDNLWSCPNLANAIQTLRGFNVDVSEFSYGRYDFMNINGIACSTFHVTEKYTVEKYLDFVNTYSAQYIC